ncbi:MAG: S-adenosylmethionine decarboxylase [Candidatus Eisenbacteria bacterium]|nr:S-adenosylmethionine decarboxylase [Candidatus Eisenbacteria bacterium]
MRAPAGASTKPSSLWKDPWPGSGALSRPALPAAAAPVGRICEVGFGPHLVFDGYGCPARRLGDLGRLYALLDRLPDQIKMTKIMPPYVFRHGSPDGVAGGLSGFVLIAESHISIHTFPGRHFVNVDVFSCENFDVEAVLAALKRAFAPRRVEWKLLDRGREFPKNIGPSRTAVLQDRVALVREMGLEVSR